LLHILDLALVENTKKVEVVFTGREKEILNLLTRGLSSKEIGEMLFISPRTVDAHKYNIMQKLNVNSSSELVYFALKNQLI
jgi:DNA-binding NarL/FixJ family response regulator